MSKINKKKAARGRNRGKTENALIDSMDKMRLLEEYLPSVERFVKEGGTIEGFLRNSTPVAYARLASLLASDKDEVAHKAAVEILNRSEGKPVERKQVLYGDVKDLNETQLDNEILKHLKQDPQLASKLTKTLSETRSEPQTTLPTPKTINLPKKAIVDELDD